MPPVPPQMLPRIGIISPTGGERSNAAARRQSAARLPSLAPHGVGRGCNMNRHAEDSWRSHVHRTYTAQRVQSFKLQTANVGGRGGDSPRLSLGVPKGVFSSEREYPLCRAVALSAALSMQRRWRCNPPSPAREIKKGSPLREENTPFAWPIQISILTPCVSMVMMLPAMATPSRMTGTARFRRISSTAAMSAPVHAPVPGSGMATKSSSPHV